MKTFVRYFGSFTSMVLIATIGQFGLNLLSKNKISPFNPSIISANLTFCFLICLVSFFLETVFRSSKMKEGYGFIMTLSVLPAILVWINRGTGATFDFYIRGLLFGAFLATLLGVAAVFGGRIAVRGWLVSKEKDRLNK